MDGEERWHKLQPMAGCDEPQGELLLKSAIDASYSQDKPEDAPPPSDDSGAKLRVIGVDPQLRVRLAQHNFDTLLEGLLVEELAVRTTQDLRNIEDDEMCVQMSFMSFIK